MLDHFVVFTFSGIVLWRFGEKLKGRPIDELIGTVLIEGRGSELSWNHDLYTLKWSFDNERELVFVVSIAAAASAAAMYWWSIHVYILASFAITVGTYNHQPTSLSNQNMTIFSVSISMHH